MAGGAESFGFRRLEGWLAICRDADSGGIESS